MHVGDKQFKTNFLLEFQSSFLVKRYEKLLLHSNLYSIRLMTILISVVHFLMISNIEGA